jgi:two-component system sensor histidine kinase MtrB
MRQRFRSFAAAAAQLIRRVSVFGRRRSVAFGELWRHSLQFRVTVSTLALSSAVVFVLGMVLQNQITERLITTKQNAAVAQTQAVAEAAANELIGIGAEPADTMHDRLTNALKGLASGSAAAKDGPVSAAGTFEPVLATGGRN